MAEEKKSCLNCGFITCANYKKTRVDCCGRYISQEKRISTLETMEEVYLTHIDELENKNKGLAEEVRLLKEQNENNEQTLNKVGDIITRLNSLL